MIANARENEKLKLKARESVSTSQRGAWLRYQEFLRLTNLKLYKFYACCQMAGIGPMTVAAFRSGKAPRYKQEQKSA